MDKVYKIVPGGKHTTVYFTNGTYACSCHAAYGKDVNGLIFTTQPNLRTDNV